jgi:hypothetical protein
VDLAPDPICFFSHPAPRGFAALVFFVSATLPGGRIPEYRYCPAESGVRDLDAIELQFFVHIPQGMARIETRLNCRPESAKNTDPRFWRFLAECIEIRRRQAASSNLLRQIPTKYKLACMKSNRF